MGPILAHQTEKFKLSGQFHFSRHPWGPWGRLSSGVICISKIYQLFCDSGAGLHSALIYYWVGRKKSEFLKNGFKPLLLTSWSTHNSNFIFGRFFWTFFWTVFGLRRPKTGQKKNFIFLIFYFFLLAL